MGLLDQGQLNVVFGSRARKVRFQDLQRYSWIAYPSRMPLRVRPIAPASRGQPFD